MVPPFDPGYSLGEHCDRSGKRDNNLTGLHRSRFHDNDDGAVMKGEQHGIAGHYICRTHVQHHQSSAKKNPARIARSPAMIPYFEFRVCQISDRLESCAKLRQIFTIAEITQPS